MMKEQARPMPIPAPSPGAPVEEQQMQSLGAEQASEEEVAQARGIVENIVTYIYSDGAPDILEQISGGNAESLGKVAGNLVTNEIAMAEEEGSDISRDIQIETIGEVIHELVDFGLHERVLNLPDEKAEQAFMGEALTYAIGAVMDSDDPQVTNESMMDLVTNMINAGEQSAQPANGIPVQQEVGDGS